MKVEQLAPFDPFYQPELQLSHPLLWQALERYTKMTAKFKPKLDGWAAVAEIIRTNQKSKVGKPKFKSKQSEKKKNAGTR